MPENPDSKMIDEVVVITHGTIYAMTIHYDKKEGIREFLTVNPDGKVGYEIQN